MIDLMVFVSSCDKYQATWGPFCHGFKRYWPECPWPVRILTNFRDPPCFRPIKVGFELSWSDAMRKGLERLDSEIVLFLADDYWLVEQVDTESLLQFARIVAQGQADYILLCSGSNTKKCDSPPDPRLFVFADDSKYRTALQASLWRVSTFLELLRDDETPWQFEVAGSRRSEVLVNRFLGIEEHRYIRYTETCLPEYDQGPVVKGKWTPSAQKYAEREGLDIDFSVNPDGTRNG